MKDHVAGLLTQGVALANQRAGVDANSLIAGQIGRGGHLIRQHQRCDRALGKISAVQERARQPAPEKTCSASDEHFDRVQATNRHSCSSKKSARWRTPSYRLKQPMRKRMEQKSVDPG